MMGPLSVAQYLAPGELRFDLIVMDEASQLKPEDAVGAIARGSQIVVVGDPKQLPPTNFFQRVTLDADEDGDEASRTVVEEGESILDVASTLYQPVRRLRWHYRSRHQSLIAFSNHEFYQGDLVIFPSAYREDSHLGVKYHLNYARSEAGRRGWRAQVAVDFGWLLPS
jgi:superfamily I DNA and/or RNA helicase